MFATNPTRSNSALAKSLQDFANRKLLTINDFDGLIQRLDNEFEQDERGLLRKQTRTRVNGDADRLYAQMLKQNIDDKSFGSFVSAFTPRATSQKERDQVRDVFNVYHKAGLTPEILQTFQEKFVVDEGKLRKLDTKTGYLSTETFEPEYVLDHYLSTTIIDPNDPAKRSPGIDRDALELNRRREKITAWKMAQDLALGEGDKVARKLFEKLERINAPVFEPVKHDFVKQSEDLKRKKLSFASVLDERDLTPSEANRVEVLEKIWIQNLNAL